METYKYRAYEIATNKIYVHDENPKVIATNAGVFTKDEGHISNNSWIFRGMDGYIISFGIGAHDKHGDDVFLGDLITCGLETIDGQRCIGVITYIHGVVGVKCLSTLKCKAYNNADTYEKWLLLIRGCSVVGNIFQHRDLLPDNAIEIIESLGYLDGHE